MDISISFGSVIKKWRITRKLTQGELASRCNLDRTFISMLERGLRQPSLTTVFTLGKVLRVEPEELVRQTGRIHSKKISRHSTMPSKRL